MAGRRLGVPLDESLVSLHRIRLLWLVIIGVSLLFAACCVSMGSARTISASARTINEFCARVQLPVGESPPRFQARLRVSDDVVTAGGQLRMRIDNLGAETISYGYAYRLERRRKGTWAQQPAKPVFSPRFYLEGGRAGACQVIRITGDASSGTYRISKTVTTAESSDRQTKTLRAIFKVQ